MRSRKAEKTRPFRIYGARLRWSSGEVRQPDKETGRHGDKEKKRLRSAAPYLPIYLSPCLFAGAHVTMLFGWQCQAAPHVESGHAFSRRPAHRHAWAQRKALASESV